MSSRSTFLTLLVVLLPRAGFFAQELTVDTDTLSPIGQSRQLVSRELARNNYPGVAVAVWQNGSLVWSEGFGYADVERGVRVDPANSLFRIGSVSKTLTSAGLAILYQAGKIDLDVPIQKYVPYFPEKPWPVSTRQVAQHVAGIRHYRGDEFLSNTHYEKVEDAIAVFSEDTLLFKPGEKYSYSSYGWNLVSGIMEGACNEPFTNFMSRNVFVPTHMMHTYPDDVKLKELPRVTFYDYRDKENIICPEVDNSLKWAGGGFISTAEDLIRFGEAILNNTLFSQETTDEFWTTGVLNNGTKTNYGLGWATNTDKKDRAWVGHSGGSVGGSSMFLVYPQDQLIVVTLINRSDARAQELAFQIANQFLN